MQVKFNTTIQSILRSPSEWTLSWPFATISEPKILIIGAGDGRHLLHSLAECSSRHSPELIILEQNLMTYARQIIFLSLVRDVGIGSSLETAQMMLEIFGNVSIRRSTFDHIRKKSAEFVEAVTSLEAKVFDFKLSLPKVAFTLVHFTQYASSFHYR